MESPVPAFREPDWWPKNPAELDPRLRSIKPEYFVFSVDRYESITRCNDAGVCTNTPNDYLNGFLPLWRWGWDRYTDMVFFSGGLDGFRPRDGIYFSINSGYWKSAGPLMVYDLAGRLQVAGKGWHNTELNTFDALRVPPYYFDENDDLILNYSTEVSYANRFMAWLRAIGT